MAPEHLKVTSSELRHAASLIDTARTEAAVAASKANNDLQARTAGWVGDSKKALEGAITELREHSENLTKRLVKQSATVNDAAVKYAKIEAKNAQKIAAAGRDAEPKLNMSH